MMEITKDKVRKVEAFMDPGPSGPGAGAANIGVGFGEVDGWLSESGWGVPVKDDGGQK